MTEYEKFIQDLTLPESQSLAPSVYAFSLHKSGSTLLYNMLAELAPHAGQPYFSIQDQFFMNGIPINEKIEGVEKLFKDKGYLYGGFRFYPSSYLLPNIMQHKKILLVRNPLDALVSMYFSRKKSHKIPEKGLLRDMWLKKRKAANEQTIDEFVFDSYSAHLNRMMSYVEILNSKNCLVFRYEDIIYEKPRFLREIVDFYAWSISDEVIQKVSENHDVIPEAEDESQHVRQVHPGNYKKHLSYESQKCLMEKFERVLSAFGYIVNPGDAKLILESS